MDQQLTNTVSAVGTYNSLPTSLSSEAVVVNLVSGLTITKSADQESWANGPLTYTITIDNQAPESYVSPVVTDIIDTTLVDFVAGSVTIDGVAATDSQYKYDEGSHTLTITLADVAPTKSSVVKFQVTQKA